MKKKAKRYAEKSDKKRKNNIVIYVFIIIFICAIIISGIKIYYWFKDNQNNNKILKEISSTIIIDNTKEDDDKNKYFVDFKRLVEQNDDTVGWLKVNGTDIEYPVVKATNNDYYLTHSFDKSYNGAGWVFADYRNKFDNTDKNIVIYGHNRRNGSMFGTLKNILNEVWYNNEENLKIQFATETETAIYQVCSIYKIEKEDYYITTNFDNDKFKTFIDTIKKRSIKDFEIDLNEDDQILTLSTCDNNNKYRVVLHAKKIQTN